MVHTQLSDIAAIHEGSIGAAEAGSAVESRAVDEVPAHPERLPYCVTGTGAGFQ